MKKKNRRNFTADFKARVALEAARGVKTINEIAAEHDLHPLQVGQWKKELLERAAAVFERGGADKKYEEAAERERARLERKIGQLTMEGKRQAERRSAASCDPFCYAIRCSPHPPSDRQTMGKHLTYNPFMKQVKRDRRKRNTPSPQGIFGLF